ncbi:hypothetical protein CEXT_148971 [Caerostris extrusa]|uniref:Uncharacterized protein n=1 Tax=Caerostris extrusa TaxID=172846 RepID=A0AAV4MZP5_CAEEX|nr:hypothetical protein CEXT_148971 [Caerostris extrusa]
MQQSSRTSRNILRAIFPSWYKSSFTTPMQCVLQCLEKSRFTQTLSLNEVVVVRTLRIVMRDENRLCFLCRVSLVATFSLRSLTAKWSY